MDDREETDRENQERENNAVEPLQPAVTRPAPNAQQPHRENVHNGPTRNPEETEPWFRKPDWWMVVLTAFTFAVGVVTLIVFYRQFGEMQTQTGILHQQAEQAAKDSIEASAKVERQLGISSKQARSAQAAVLAMKDQTRLGQRAWVAMYNVNTKSTVAVGSDFHASTIVENFGHSPANRVMPIIAIHIFCGDFPPNPPYPALPVHRPYSYLMPSEPRDAGRASLGHPMTEPEMQSIVSGKCSLYMHGEVRYCDIFGESHYRHFCAEWVVGTQNGFQGCNAYADGDEDYPHTPTKSCKE